MATLFVGRPASAISTGKDYADGRPRGKPSQTEYFPLTKKLIPASKASRILLPPRLEDYDGQSRDRLEIGGGWLVERSRHKGGNGPRPERSEPSGDQCACGTNRRRTKAPPMRPGRSESWPTERAKALFLSSDRTAPGAGALRNPILHAGVPHAAANVLAQFFLAGEAEQRGRPLPSPDGRKDTETRSASLSG